MPSKLCHYLRGSSLAAPYAEIRSFRGESHTLLRFVQLLFLLQQISDIDTGPDVTKKVIPRIISRYAAIRNCVILTVMPEKCSDRRQGSGMVRALCGSRCSDRSRSATPLRLTRLSVTFPDHGS